MKKMQENELHLDDSSSSSFSDVEEKKENDNNKNEIINGEIKKSILEKMKEFFRVSNSKEDSPLKHDENRTIEEIIASKGFRVQKHYIKTEDGYTLVIFRIPGIKSCLDSSSKPPVLFQHGIFDSSDGWVCNGVEHSIPFIFAKNNFDVWISNSRGNKYCKEHEKFDNKSFEFWQFSFHEMGIYDIPAIINYLFWS